MKKIAFKNFRRFQEFPELELGNISIMVGRNNSGKSTMVKAFLLALDYLQNQQYDKFSFTNKSLEDVNIVTFGRALNNKKESNEIVFVIELDGFVFSIFIYGNNDDTDANVSKLTIDDNNSGTRFEIDYNDKILAISKANATFISKNNVLEDLTKEIEDKLREIESPDFKNSTPEGLRILDRFNKLVERNEKYLNLIKLENEESKYDLFFIEYPLLPNLDNKTEDTILQEFVSDFIVQNNSEIKKLKSIRNKYAHNNNNDEKLPLTFEQDLNGDVLLDDKSDLEKLEEKIQELVDIDNYKSELTKSIDEAIRLINRTTIYYLGANPGKQSALFSLRDKQNNLAQAIHDFKQSKILNGETEYEFVRHWMKEFEVGEDFEIKFYAGEAYEFYVTYKDGYKAHLADKGMGSLQAMMIILKVATIMRKHKSSMKYVTIIVEEPELNLHPEFQGKLADFFHDVNKEYHINFIIETHSEYLIRKSQNILVKEDYTNDEGLNPNPFKLHYFDIVNGPYEMKYLDNGKFDRKFGKGFFDYADDLEVETYKLNLKKNK